MCGKSDVAIEDAVSNEVIEDALPLFQRGGLTVRLSGTIRLRSAIWLMDPPGSQRTAPDAQHPGDHRRYQRLPGRPGPPLARRPALPPLRLWPRHQAGPRPDPARPAALPVPEPRPPLRRPD